MMNGDWVDRACFSDCIMSDSSDFCIDLLILTVIVLGAVIVMMEDTDDDHR